MTVVHNGVVVQNGATFWGPTLHKQIGAYTPDTAKGPLALQDYGNPVRYRNVWIRPLTRGPSTAKPSLRWLRHSRSGRAATS